MSSASPSRYSRESCKRSVDKDGILAMPDAVVRPLLDKYVELYFGRMAHQVVISDHNHDDFIDQYHEDVTPLLEATMNDDEGGVFILLLHISTNLREDCKHINNDNDRNVEMSRSGRDKGNGQRRCLDDYVNARTLPRKWTSLHIAAQNGNESIVRLLLEYGANDSLIDVNGWTPLAFAIDRGHESIFNLLLSAEEKRQGTSSSSPSSWTPRYVLWRDLESGESLLHIAVKRGHYSIAQTLLNKGVDSNAMGGRSRKTALHYAAEAGNLEMVRLLVMRYDADIHIPERRDRRTALHLAVSCGYDDSAISTTLNSNAWCSPCIEDRGTTNHGSSDPAEEFWTTTTRSLIVQLLINHGAHINERDRYGYTALHLAIAFDYVPPTDTRTASTVNDNLIKNLLKCGSDPTLPNEYGETALHRAVMEDNELCLRLILDSFDGCDDVEMSSADSNAGLPSAASDQKRIDLLNAPNNEGLTPLHCAVQLEHESIVRILIERYHADINVTDVSNHRTPLYIAVQLNNEMLVRLLIHNGASKVIPDQYGRKPWDIAATYGFHRIFPLLS